MRTWLSCLFLLLTATGCAGFGYTGKSRELPVDAFKTERGWVAIPTVPLFIQRGRHDCGPTALAMVLRYWDPAIDVHPLLDAPADQRVSARSLRDSARAAGFPAFVMQGTVEDLVHEIKAGRPVILGMAKPTATGPIAHYEVLIGFHPATGRVALLDPAIGARQASYRSLLEEWTPTGSVLLAVLPRKPASGT